MKNLTFLLIFLFFAYYFNLSAQVSQQWVARYTGLGGLNGDQANSIAVDASGNVYVTGVSAGVTHWGDYATIKYNSSGVQQWVQRYNGPGDSDDVAVSIAVDASGNVYVTGKSIGAGTSYDYATIKYNTNGVQQWIARYNNPWNYFDEAVALKIDGSGNVYVTGESYDPVNLIVYATVKYNSSGVQQWVQRYNGYLGEPKGLAVDGAGNVYVTGNNVLSQRKIVTVKYNSSGVQQWASIYPGPADFATGIAIDGSGNIYVSGLIWNFAIIKYNSSGVQVWAYDPNEGPADVPTSIAVDGFGNAYVTGVGWFNGSNDYATIKLDSSGVQQWLANYNGPADSLDYANSIAVDASGNVYVTGLSKSNQTSYDYATVKYNSSGVQQWVQRYNGPGNSSDVATSIAIDGSGNVYVTGYSIGIGTGWDYATIKYSQPTGINPISSNVPKEYGLSQNYPNPFNPTTKIKFDLPSPSPSERVGVRLVIYDILGRQVATLVNEPLRSGTYEVTFDGTNLTSGLYFYKLTSGTFTQTKKMVLVK